MTEVPHFILVFRGTHPSETSKNTSDTKQTNVLSNLGQKGWLELVKKGLSEFKLAEAEGKQNAF